MVFVVVATVVAIVESSDTYGTNNGQLIPRIMDSAVKLVGLLSNVLSIYLLPYGLCSVFFCSGYFDRCVAVINWILCYMLKFSCSLIFGNYTIHFV